MVEKIVIDPEAYTNSKLSTAVFAQISAKMDEQTGKVPRPKAKGKWQEMVPLSDGNRYAVNCHKEGELIVVTGARPAQKKGRRIWPWMKE
jgi:hypothetical protein